MIRPVDCRTFEFWSEDLADPHLESSFRTALIEHRGECARCGEFATQSQHQRRALRSLQPHSVPIHLAVNLRILASKDRASRAAHRDWSARLQTWREQVRFWVSNLWKPIAIPTAGGLASACILFSALMPTFALDGRTKADVPAAWFQAAQVNGLSPFGIDTDQITLDVRIASDGKVIEYWVPRGENDALFQNMALRRAVENSLLFMSFRPASFFGQPASDIIRITIRRSQIEVKG